MKEAVTTSDALIQRLSEQRAQRLRKNVQILFLGLTPEETSPIISLLRGARLAPRGRQILAEEDFLHALTERSWDLIICTLGREELLIKQAIHHLKRLDKDIPVIQLVSHADTRYLLQGLKAGMQAVVPLEDKELLLLVIRRELDNLENRRRMRQAETLLSESEKRCRLLMERSTLAIAYFDADRLLLANPAFAQLFGYDNASKLEGSPIDLFVVQQDREELYEQVRVFAEENLKELIFQLTGRRSDDSNFNAHIELQETRLNNKPCVQVTVRPEKTAQQTKAFSGLDPITGLLNGDSLQKEIDKAIHSARKGGNDCHLLYLCVSNFAHLRAELGSDACDHLSRDLADLLNQSLNPVHIKGRISESAFGVLFSDPNPDKAITVAKKLWKTLSEHSASVGKQTFHAHCAIGLTTLTDTAPESTEVLSRVVSAAEQSLTAAAPHVQLFTPKPTTSSADDQAFENLKQAIDDESFKLLYQPVVPLSYNSKIRHYEALLRMLDEKENELAPALFLNQAETHDMSAAVGRWVIHESIKQLRKELDKGHKYRLFVSVTSATWRDQNLLSWLAEQLRQHRIPADHLVFQISENDCTGHLEEAKAFSDALKQLHCLICIKHYGSTGFSQQVLKQINSDYVKLDGSFIQELIDKPATDESFELMIEDLKSQGKITIAPLVENPKVMSRLWKTGVGLIQGYYLQPPGERMDYDFFEG